MGRIGVLAGVHGAVDHCRPARRHPWPTKAFPRRPDHLHRGQPGLRAVPDAWAADRLPRPAGPWRRAAGAAGAGDHHLDPAVGEARTRVRGDRHHVRPRRAARAHVGRFPGDQLRLAVDLLPECADRHRRDRAGLRVHARRAARGPSQARPARGGIADRRTAGCRLRPDRGPALRLGDGGRFRHHRNDHCGGRGVPRPVPVAPGAHSAGRAAAAVRGLRRSVLHDHDPGAAGDGVRDGRDLPADDDLLPVGAGSVRGRRRPGDGH